MVKLKTEHDTPSIDLTFAALADPTRRAILARLAEDAAAGAGGQGVRVTELAAPFTDAMSLPAVSKHLRVLERAGLLRQEKDGRVRRCHLEPEPLQAAHEWVAHYQRFWSQKLDALADYLENESLAPSPQPRSEQAQPARNTARRDTPTPKSTPHGRKKKRS
ncbi:MAG: metalloregulator ArsR/SmtB family transcription factor [Planctomycetota bacterium]